MKNISNKNNKNNKNNQINKNNKNNQIKKRADLPELNAAFLANNLWLLVASILVIMVNVGVTMVGVGLGPTGEGAISLMTQNILVFFMSVLTYWFVGYSLMYGGSVADGWLYFGGLFFDPTVNADMVTDAGLVPAVDHLFQSFFAATSAIVMSTLLGNKLGKTFAVVLSIILSGIIYPISGSWKWNGGWLDSLGFVDFAGSSIVHTVGATAGLVALQAAGKLGSEAGTEITASNPILAAVGALLAFFGYFGFNAGSQLAMDQWVPYVALTTSLAATGSVAGVAILSKILKDVNLDYSHVIKAILAGLVSITAGCGDMTLPGSWFTGLVGGMIMLFSSRVLKPIDPHSIFSIFGLCGIFGSLVIGLWGTAVLGDGAGYGLFNGGGINLLLIQALGSAVYAIWPALTTYLVVLLLKVFIKK